MFVFNRSAAAVLLPLALLLVVVLWSNAGDVVTRETRVAATDQEVGQPAPGPATLTASNHSPAEQR
jgi:hypothetical protein